MALVKLECPWVCFHAIGFAGSNPAQRPTFQTYMKNVTIVLTEEEAKELSSLLTRKCGMIQYQGTQENFNGRELSEERREALNASWHFWHGMSQKVSSAFGFEAWMEPSAYASEEVDMKVAKSVLELPLEPKH